MVNPRSKTAGRKDRGSREPDAPPIVPPPPPTCPETQHGSSDTLLNILLGMQQQQQQQMTLLQQQLAAQQQQIEVQQQQQQQQARPSNYFLELKEAHAPTFAGSRDPLEVEKWITEMEMFCRAFCIPKDEWVNVTIPFLIADAEAWFIAVRPAYESGGRRMDWAQFRDIFYLNYFPATFRIEKENEFFNLRQGNMTLIQYASMFNQLGRFVPTFMVQERSKVTRFEEGLNLNLRECMGTPQATTYHEVLEQALRAERLITERNQNRDCKRPRPWNEQYEETESAANKKATRANKKAIQEDLYCSTVHGQDDEVYPDALKFEGEAQPRIIRLPSFVINSAENNSLHAASEKQRKVDEKVMRFAETQKKQIEAFHKRIIQLEKDLDQKHALQLDVERLREKLNVLKKAEELQKLVLMKKAKELQKLLIEKEAEIEDKINLHQSLIVNERNINDELLDARQELINVCTCSVIFVIYL